MDTITITIHIATMDTMATLTAITMGIVTIPTGAMIMAGDIQGMGTQAIIQQGQTCALLQVVTVHIQEHPMGMLQGMVVLP